MHKYARLLTGVAIALMVTPITGFAQGTTASINGTVVDEGGLVLPGVTVTAVHTESNRPYVTVTGGQGDYSVLAMTPGVYSVEASLVGFGVTRIEELELLIGQTAIIGITLTIGGIEETLTVTAESPLVDIRSAEVTGNVDRRQMEELPLQGRNWLEMTQFVKGITTNNISRASTPVSSPDQWQVNIDGQQITQRIGTQNYATQPRISRDAIAEFQIDTHAFDVTKGRSLGMQLNAISKAGGNELTGSTYGYFRSDKFNKEDFVADKVLPYKNQQIGGTLGGPLRQDKVHFFGSYEYELEPYTVFSQPAELPGQTFPFDSQNQTHIQVGRVDVQATNNDHLSFRTTGHIFTNPTYRLTGTNHPSNLYVAREISFNVQAAWSKVIGNSLTVEARGGWGRQRFYYGNEPGLGCTFDIEPDCVSLVNNFIDPGRTPEYRFPGGLRIGPTSNLGQIFLQRTPSVRFDVTYLKGSDHTVKIGGEWLRHGELGNWHLQERGVFNFHSTPPDLVDRFPASAWNNPDQWNVAGLEPYVTKFDQNFRPDWMLHIPRAQFALWAGDEWRVSDKLTLTYGLRYDNDLGFISPPNIVDRDIIISNGFDPANTNFGYISGLRDHNNIQPRAGFAYDVTGEGRMVIRGGTGIYHGSPANLANVFDMYNRMVGAEWFNDGEPGFMGDPRRGLTFQQLFECIDPAACTVPAELMPPATAMVFRPDYQMNYSWQNSIGWQHQIGPTMGYDIDIIQWNWYHDRQNRDANLFYNPDNGRNLHPGTFGRPNPDFGLVRTYQSTGRRDYLALANSFTRRLQNNLQAGITYTLIFKWNEDSTSNYGPNNHFDLSGEWARDNNFQKHTVRSYMTYHLPGQASVSAVYFYGSGNFFTTTLGGSPFGIGGQNRYNGTGATITVPANLQNRWHGATSIPDGSELARHALQGTPLHRVDVRFTKDIPVGESVRVSLIAELFNLLNHVNYGTFVGNILSGSFGQPRSNALNAYQPRRGQVAVHLRF